MPGSMWNETFEVPDGSCSVSNIHVYFEDIAKKYGTFTDPPTRIYVNEKENSITFRI